MAGAEADPAAAAGSGFSWACCRAVPVDAREVAGEAGAGVVEASAVAVADSEDLAAGVAEAEAPREAGSAG